VQMRIPIAVPAVVLAVLLVVAANARCGETVAPAADAAAELKAKVEALTKAQEAEKQRREAETQKQNAQIEELLKKLERLEKSRPAEQATNSPSAPAAPSLFGESVGRAFQSFNPDLSVIGDFLYKGVSGERGERQPGGENVNEDRFQVRQVELALSGSVDPYARADIFVHIEEEDGEWHVGLCEGYLTLLDLPADLQARAGKFRSRFGKANTMHLHSMPWPDQPSMITNFFGEEGMSEEGAELSWLVPNPWDIYTELIYSAQNNENPASFAGDQADDVMHVAHLKTFFDLSRDLTMELGASGATAPNDDGHGGQRTNLYGADLTFKWRSPTQGLYQSLTWQSEVLASDKDQPDGGDVNSWGAYSSLEYQFARRWSTFGRYDYSELPDDDNARENSYSAGITFAQSEYCFWRLGVKHSDYDGGAPEEQFGDHRNVLFLQLNFGLGPHRAHQY